MKKIILSLLLFFMSISTINGQSSVFFQKITSISDLFEDEKKFYNYAKSKDTISDSTFILYFNTKRVFYNLKFAPSIIMNIYGWDSNSVGGITMNVNIINCSSKTIKYTKITGYFENSVNDICYNQINKNKFFTVTGIGPIKGRSSNSENDINIIINDINNSSVEYSFEEPFFYSNIAKYLIISSVQIEYTDKTKKIFKGSILKKIINYLDSDDWGGSINNPLNPLN